MKWKHVMERIELEHFAGREKETDAFAAWWSDAGRQRKLIHVHGTAGIGKSLLLKQFRRMAEQRGGLVASWDANSLLPDPSAWCMALARQLRTDEPEREEAPVAGRSEDEWLGECMRQFERGKQGGPALLLIDHYKSAGARMDEWCGQRFCRCSTRMCLL